MLLCQPAIWPLLSRAATPLLPPPPAAPRPLPPAAPPHPNGHVVVTGDLPDSIAANCSVSLTALLAINPNINEAKALIPGQVIRIPPWPITCTLGNYFQALHRPCTSHSVCAHGCTANSVHPVFCFRCARAGCLGGAGGAGTSRGPAVQNTTSFRPVITAGVDKAFFNSSAGRSAKAPACPRALPPWWPATQPSPGGADGGSQRGAAPPPAAARRGRGRRLPRQIAQPGNPIGCGVAAGRTSSGTLAALNKASEARHAGHRAICHGADPGARFTEGGLRRHSPAAAPAAAPSAAPGQVSSVPPPHLWAACLPPAHSLPLVRPALGNSHLPAILGGAIGGGVALLVVLSVVVVLVLWHRRAATRENVTRDSTLRSKDFVP